MTSRVLTGCMNNFFHIWVYQQRTKRGEKIKVSLVDQCRRSCRKWPSEPGTILGSTYGFVRIRYQGQPKAFSAASRRNWYRAPHFVFQLRRIISQNQHKFAKLLESFPYQLPRGTPANTRPLVDSLDLDAIIYVFRQFPWWTTLLPESGTPMLSYFRLFFDLCLFRQPADNVPRSDTLLFLTGRCRHRYRGGQCLAGRAQFRVPYC